MTADWLIAHELEHVRRFQALGREAMVRRGLTETLTPPGNLIPFDREAIVAVEAVTGPGGRYAY